MVAFTEEMVDVGGAKVHTLKASPYCCSTAPVGTTAGCALQTP